MECFTFLFGKDPECWSTQEGAQAALAEFSKLISLQTNLTLNLARRDYFETATVDYEDSHRISLMFTVAYFCLSFFFCGEMSYSIVKMNKNKYKKGAGFIIEKNYCCDQQ